MSCGHDHCTCNRTDTPHTGKDRNLPTVTATERPADRTSGCCSGHRHANDPDPAPARGN